MATTLSSGRPGGTEKYFPIRSVEAIRRYRTDKAAVIAQYPKSGGTDSFLCSITTRHRQVPAKSRKRFLCFNGKHPSMSVTQEDTCHSEVIVDDLRLCKKAISIQKPAHGSRIRNCRYRPAYSIHSAKHQIILTWQPGPRTRCAYRPMPSVNSCVRK